MIVRTRNSHQSVTKAIVCTCHQRLTARKSSIYLESFSMSFHQTITPPPSSRSLASTTPSPGSSAVCLCPITGSERSWNACFGVRPSEANDEASFFSDRIAFNSLLAQRHIGQTLCTSSRVSVEVRMREAFAIDVNCGGVWPSSHEHISLSGNGGWNWDSA